MYETTIRIVKIKSYTKYRNPEELKIGDLTQFRINNKKINKNNLVLV